MKLELIKENEKWKTYNTDKCKILYRNKWFIAGDNEINQYELIYLINGKAEITLKNEMRIIEAPEVFEFPVNTYHKIYALTDISFIVFNK